MIKGRFIFVLGTFFLTLLLYVDRICISVAKDPIAKSLDLSKEQMGWVLSAFALGYALFQTPGGMLADKLGARKVLTVIVIVWSLFTGFTAKAWNYVSMLLIRFLFGAGEAGAFPAINRAVVSWIPLNERGIVTGINFSGSRLGAAFALPLLSVLITNWGWQNTFYLLGAIGVGFAFIWYWLFKDKPEEHPLLSLSEKEFIVTNRQPITTVVAKLPFKNILVQGNMWLAMLQYFCSNFTFFFALTWLYPHIKEKFHLEAVAAGWYASLPLIAGAAGNWFSGWWMDNIYTKGNYRKSRWLPAATGFSLSAAGLIISSFMTDVNAAVLFLSLAIFGADMTLPPSWAFCADIGKQQAGAVSGNMNMAGNLGAFITSLAFPYLLSWVGSPSVFFYLAAVLNIAAIFTWLKMNPEKTIN
ncbi:MFS transporter [Lacibacter sp.]|uniref:MFS transporter n=1 Tax=Lacibacter sp. TaxID=1915409 RepID=UPI002B4B2208|nr:MFS transporter [Lacibacter sp.]HLP37616.1 MFS transporter [Lacibacter sp.]